LRQNYIYEITELFLGEFVSLQIGDQTAAAIDDRGME
jgi:hypothetical protein